VQAARDIFGTVGSQRSGPTRGGLQVKALQVTQRLAMLTSRKERSVAARLRILAGTWEGQLSRDAYYKLGPLIDALDGSDTLDPQSSRSSFEPRARGLVPQTESAATEVALAALRRVRGGDSGGCLHGWLQHASLVATARNTRAVPL